MKDYIPVFLPLPKDPVDYDEVKWALFLSISRVLFVQKIGNSMPTKTMNHRIWASKKLLPGLFLLSMLQPVGAELLLVHGPGSINIIKIEFLIFNQIKNFKKLPIFQEVYYLCLIARDFEEV